MPNRLVPRVLAYATIATAIAGCFGSTESDVPDIEEPGLEAQAPYCNPPCGAGRTCQPGNCCVHNATPFEECELQDDADLTVVVDDLITDTAAALVYGGTECSSKLVVDVVQGDENWETIRVSKAISGVTECGCKSYEGYLKVTGLYYHYVCLANGCAPCGPGCGQYYPFADFEHEAVVTASATWVDALNQCRISLTVPRLSGSSAPGPNDRFDGSVEVHAEIRHKGTHAHKPVSVLVTPET